MSSALLWRPVVPLYYNANAEIVKNVVKACYNGGARVFEFTNRGDCAHQVFDAVNKWCAIECPEMIMGVGSVCDTGTAALYIQLGAGFIVSPSLNPIWLRSATAAKWHGSRVVEL